MKCPRCGIEKVGWNDAGYLVCFNCGKIIARPKDPDPMTEGLMEWISQVKERLWRERLKEGYETLDDLKREVEEEIKMPSLSDMLDTKENGVKLDE